MTGFSGLAWHSNLALYDRVLALPFNQELREGSLALSRFRHYIIQDTHYLEGVAVAWLCNLTSGNFVPGGAPAGPSVGRAPRMGYPPFRFSHSPKENRIAGHPG